MEINLHVDSETVEELLEAGLSEAMIDIARSEIPDMDDYFEKGDADDFVHRAGFEADVADMVIEWMSSMPSDPTARCALGEAFTAAVERVVLNSLDVTTRIRYVVDGVGVRRLVGDRDVDAEPGDDRLRTVAVGAQLGERLVAERVERAPQQLVLVAEHLAPAPVAASTNDEDATDMVREVMVLPMNGDRRDVATVTVWTNADDTGFEVRRGTATWRYPSAGAAFSEAFARAAWNVRTHSTSP